MASHFSFLAAARIASHGDDEIAEVPVNGTSTALALAAITPRILSASFRHWATYSLRGTASKTTPSAYTGSG